MSKLDRSQHIGFGNFASESFDHGDFFGGRRNNHVHVAFFKLVVSRETDQFAINASDSSRCNRILKGQGTDEAGRCRSVHRQHIAVGLLVAGEHEVLALDFVFEARCEHGSDRTVDQTCSQRFFGRGTTFAFDEATGELTRSTGSLAVVTH